MVIRPIVSAMFLPFAVLHATQPDSTSRTYALDEVVITATRAEALRSSVAAPVSVIDSGRIALTPGTLLASALATTPGLSIREYGGNSAVRSISMRGFGPENVLVLVDGLRVNSYQNGGVDFGLVPLSEVSRVEIVRGGQSGLYGADAVGGIINIHTRRPSGLFSAGLETTIGGFGFSALEGRAEGGGEGSAWRAVGRRERGNGGYGFTFDDGARHLSLTREGADFRVDRLDGKIELNPSDAVHVYTRGAWTDANRGSPGPVTDPGGSGRARLYDRMLTAHTGVDWTATGQIQAHLLADLQYAEERYVDPSTLLGGVTLDSRSLTRSIAVQPQVRWTPAQNTLLALDGELNRAWMSGSDTRNALRWQGGIGLTGQQVVALGTSLPVELVVYPSVRFDRISDVGHDVSAKIGMNLGITDAPLLRMRASYGKNFRAPTFNELYWVAGGNPRLRPERSLSADLGATMLLDLWGQVSLDVNAFRTESRDRIVWLPATGTYWSPQNIGEVTSRGIETEVRWRLPIVGLEVLANSTWQKAAKTSSDYPGDPTEGALLPYVPEQTATVQVTAHLASVDVSLQNIWTSFRYTNPTNSEFVPAFSVTSATVGAHRTIMGAALSMKLDLLNLFNTRYSSFALYPMPGREVRVTLGVTI